MAGSKEEGSYLPFFYFSVLENRSAIPYTVPSFPVFTAMLQPLSVLLQWEDSPDEIFICI